MRVVADTSTVVSGLMWRGKPRQVLDAARTRTISLFTSTTLAEPRRVNVKEIAVIT